MAEFSTVITAFGRMCKSFGSCEDGCPLHEWHKQCYYEDCYPELGARPEEAAKIIMQWAVEHRGKTRLQKFRELFPTAPLSGRYALPNMCVKSLGWSTEDDDCSKSSCFDCWSRPYEDQRGESRDL